MYKTILSILSILVSLNTIFAQDIISKLGGNTANETFDMTDSNDNLIFRVQGDGNVGIGSTNPLSKLSVGGDGTSSSTIFGGTVDDIGVYGFASGITGKGVYGWASHATSALPTYGGYFHASGKASRAVYGLASNGGSVTTTAYGGYFESWGYSGYGVAGYASGTYGRGVYGCAYKTGPGINYGGYFEAKEDAGRGVHGESLGSSGTGVYGNGGSTDFWAQNGTYGNSSSIRWKRNIVEIDNPLEKLSELRGVYFDWDEEHGSKHTVGMIAEEVGKVLPEIVFYEENGIDAKGMDYSKLTPLLVEIAKAQQKLIEDLKHRITKLEKLLSINN